MTKRRISYYLFVFSVLVILFVYAAYWKIAKDEVYFLCTNFKAGNASSSVLRQLDTADLSTYSMTKQAYGTNIEFSSKLNFRTFKCIIAVDENEKVISARFTSS